MDAEALPVKKKRFKWLTPELRITLRYFLCFAMFFSIIDRWLQVSDHMEDVSDSSLINPSYASEIETETYLMRHEQLKQLFQKTPPAKLVHWDARDAQIINDPNPMYLVLRIRNRGDKNVWGKLQIHSKRWSMGTGIDTRIVPIHNLPPNMKEFEILILAGASYVSSMIPSKLNWDTPSDITVDWGLLYTSTELNHGR